MSTGTGTSAIGGSALDLNDSVTLTGLLPTLDHQELRRTPALSSHLTRPGLADIGGIFHDTPNVRTVLTVQDGSIGISQHDRAEYRLDLGDLPGTPEVC